MRHAAFMRGLNVGKGHRVTNDELAAVYRGLDLIDPTPYQASGNVVFDMPSEKPATAKQLTTLEAALADALEEQLGYAVPTLVRTDAEVTELAAATPFAEDVVAASDGKVQVLLLASSASKKLMTEVEALLPDGEHLVFDDRVMFWLPVEGISTSTFKVPVVEKMLGVCTMRTQGTLQRMVKKFLDT